VRFEIFLFWPAGSAAAIPEYITDGAVKAAWRRYQEALKTYCHQSKVNALPPKNKPADRSVRAKKLRRLSTAHDDAADGSGNAMEAVVDEDGSDSDSDGSDSDEVERYDGDGLPHDVSRGTGPCATCLHDTGRLSLV